MTSDTFTGWRKATYSHANGSCVEVGAAGRTVGIRDTTQAGQGLMLQFPSTVWLAFIENAKRESA
jgi:hypothetical protein